MAVDNKEKEELKATIRNLEEKLKGKNMYSLNILLLTSFNTLKYYYLQITYNLKLFVIYLKVANKAERPFEDSDLNVGERDEMLSQDRY